MTPVIYTFDYVTTRSYPQAILNLSHNQSFILSLSNDEETVRCDRGAGAAIDAPEDVFHTVRTVSDHTQCAHASDVMSRTEGVR